MSPPSVLDPRGRCLPAPSGSTPMAAWCSGPSAGLLLIGSGFEAASGFDFFSQHTWFLMRNSGWVEW